MEINWKTGEPEKDGTYYVKTRHYAAGADTWAIHINTLDYTTRYGWNTVRFNGEFIKSDNYDPSDDWGVLGYAEVEPCE